LLWLFCRWSLEPPSLLISASQVARITGVSHQCLAWPRVLCTDVLCGISLVGHITLTLTHTTHTYWHTHGRTYTSACIHTHANTGCERTHILLSQAIGDRQCELSVCLGTDWS
jgi:hypothetical protein